MAAAAPQTFLFRPFNKRGSTLQDSPMHEFMIWHSVKKYTRQAGLQVDRLGERGICAHSTRGSRLLRRALRAGRIQQLVGHKDPRYTLRYRRASPKDVVNAVLLLIINHLQMALKTP
jgi:integrase